MADLVTSGSTQDSDYARCVQKGRRASAMNDYPEGHWQNIASTPVKNRMLSLG